MIFGDVFSRFPAGTGDPTPRPISVLGCRAYSLKGFPVRASGSLVSFEAPIKNTGPYKSESASQLLVQFPQLADARPGIPPKTPESPKTITHIPETPKPGSQAEGQAPAKAENRVSDAAAQRTFAEKLDDLAKRTFAIVRAIDGDRPSIIRWSDE